MNRIILGDNLEVLPTLPEACARLIYIDPPFNTGKTQKRQRIKAIADEVRGDRQGFGGRSYRTESIGSGSYGDEFDDYLDFLMPRIMASLRCLTPDGSLFVHLDWREVHYVKVALDRLPTAISHWRLVRGLALLAGDARKVFLVPGHALRVLGWGVVGHVNVALAVYILARGLDLDVGLVDCLALIPPVLLITTLPISIAGWGVRELSMVAAFGLIGVPDEGAVALSVVFGLVVAVMSLPGGLIWLLGEDRGAKIEAAPRD